MSSDFTQDDHHREHRAALGRFSVVVVVDRWASRLCVSTVRRCGRTDRTSIPLRFRGCFANNQVGRSLFLSAGSTAAIGSIDGIPARSHSRGFVLRRAVPHKGGDPPRADPVRPAGTSPVGNLDRGSIDDPSGVDYASRLAALATLSAPIAFSLACNDEPLC